MRMISPDEAKKIARDFLVNPYDAISTCTVIDKTPTIDAVHAAGGCYCRECRWHCNCEIEYHGQFGPNSFCCAGEPKEAAHEVSE